MASLKLTSATILTMNDALDDRRRRPVDPRRTDRRGRRRRSVIAPRPGDRRRRRAGPARLHPDPRAPVPDAVPRARRRPAAADVAARRGSGRSKPRTTPASLAASARLAAAELLLGGTTTVLTMETVHDTDAVFEALAPTGLRAVVGKCLMDAAERRTGPTARAGRTRRSTRRRRWRGAGTAPPTAGCRRRSRRASRCRARARCSKARPASPASTGLLVHTHASEQRDEVALVRARTGRRQRRVPRPDRAGVAAALPGPLRLGRRPRAVDLLAGHDVKVLHCPGSNLKLGSGIAPVVEMRRPRHLGVAGRRWRRVQQPPRHVRRDAAGGHRCRRCAAVPGR